MIPVMCLAAEPDSLPLRPVLTSTMFDMGRTGRLYDSYLSIMNYAGWNVGLRHERLQMSRRRPARMLTRHDLSLDYTSARNKPGNGVMMMGMLGYDYGLLYTARMPVRGLTLYGGGQAGTRIGFIYNMRNSNNPATAKVDARLSLSGMAVYRFRIKRYPLTLRYQLSLPVAGVFFGPEFGQSYYEMFELGNRAGTVHFGSFHNQFYMDNLVSLDLPLGRGALRLGYRNSVYSTRQDYIDTRIYTNSLVIGVTTEFITWNRYKPAVTGRRILPVYE